MVALQGASFPVTIDADRTGATVRFADGARMRVASDWTPGQTLARLDVDGDILVLKVARIPAGYRIRVRGADLKVAVMSPRTAELAALMPAKAPPDTSKLLLCPMPGLVVRIDVGGRRRGVRRPGALHGRGDEDGERAARRAEGEGLAHPATEGDSLAVDDVIMEFE